MTTHGSTTSSLQPPRIAAYLALVFVLLACVACGSSPTTSATTTAPPSSTAPTSSVPSSTEPPSTTPATTAPTLPPSPQALSVLQTIDDASKITTIPADLTPALEDFANPAQAKTLWGPWFVRPCDPYVNPSQASNPTPCIFGDAASTRTIVLVGDSNVGNWAPALDIGLKAAGYRLAVFAFASCPTPDLTYPSPSYGTLTGALLTECNQWHQTVPAAISALHPIAVLAASGSTYLNVLTDQQWINGFAKLFDESTAGSPSAVRILMGTSPFPGPSPNCLAATSNPQTCAFSFTPGSATGYPSYVTRDALIAAASDATLIPTYPWFCHAGTCSPVVSNYLVYADTDHPTIAYSDYLAPVVTGAVLNAIAAHS
ncbi:MAG: SGNH hydrolase domain-containing protein [Acidimicrobiales bacterium]|jgi:hypothetical protein